MSDENTSADKNGNKLLQSVKAIKAGKAARFGRVESNKVLKEEKQILDSFEAGELQRSPDFEVRKTRHQQYAEAMLRKDARIKIRLSLKDLRGL